MDRGDVRVRQVCTWIVGRDRRIVPLGDLALENLRGGLRGQLQVVDTREVVDDRDRR
jgi:hypothetical protein